jgi:nitrogenase molybdenum-iron protein alpha/beta subunit
MIVLKDVLSPLEWRTTMQVLKITKTVFGQDDYYLFKKMVMVAGFIHGLDGYFNYQGFINIAFDMLNHHISPINTLSFNARKMTDSFFGVSKKFICESSLNKVRDMMANKRKEMLKAQEIQRFTL